MGGAISEISDGTTDVAIESAIFDPVSIRRTAQRLALRSEASSRFEKGQEPGLARLGADRTAQLIRAWAGGEIARGASTRRPTCPGRPASRSGPARVNRLLGTDALVDEQRELLARVGVDTEPAPDGAPGHRRPQARAAGRPRDRRGRDGHRAHLAPRHRRSRPTSPRRSPASAATSSFRSVTPDTAMPAFRPSPLEVARARARDARGRRPDRGRHDRAGVAPPRRDVRARTRGPVRGRGASAGRRPDRRDQPAVARPLAAAPQPLRQPARRRGRQPAPRHRGRRGVRDRQGLRSDRDRAARVVAPGLRAGRLGRGRRVEPPGAPVRPRRRQGPAGAAGRPAGSSRDRCTQPERGRGRCSTPGRTARADAAGRLHALVGELHPARRRRLGAAHRRPRDPRRGRASTGSRRAAWRPSGRRRRAGSPRSSATSRSSCPRRRRGRGRGPDARATADRCCGTSACSTSTAACRSRTARRASRSGSGSAPRTGRSPRPRSRPRRSAAGSSGRAAAPCRGSALRGA